MPTCEFCGEEVEDAEAHNAERHGVQPAAEAEEQESAHVDTEPLNE